MTYVPTVTTRLKAELFRASVGEWPDQIDLAVKIANLPVGAPISDYDGIAEDPDDPANADADPVELNWVWNAAAYYGFDTLGYDRPTDANAHTD